MKRFFALLLALLLLGACAGPVPDAPTTTEPTTAPIEPAVVLLPGITVISNGEAHEPYVQLLYSATYDKDWGLINADADILLDLVEQLPETPYADDFQIRLSGSYAAYEITVQCALYDHDDESIFALHRDEPKSVEDFTFPDKAGVYLLNVEVSWRRGEECACYAHVFKIRK